MTEAIAGVVKVKELQLAQPWNTTDFLAVDLKCNSGITEYEGEN